MGKDNSKQNIDEKMSSSITRRDFIKVSAGTVACISLGSLTFGCSNSGGTQVPGYPIDSNVTTTLQKTVKLSQSFSGTIAAQDLQNVSEYDAKGYGVWLDGGPLAAVQRSDIMANGYVSPSGAAPVRLLRFFAITDIHITDKESPSQLIYMQPFNEHGDATHAIEAAATSVYSPTMLYTTHVLDAVVQTVNALHKQEPQHPIDFGISLGDATNSTQYNETRWYIDVLDGKVITPSSGAHDGAGIIDYQKPYKAAGLDPAIPWYQVLGNHDHFWLGAIPHEAGDLRNSYTSDEVIAMPNALARGSAIYNLAPPLYYMGVIDGSTPTGKIIKAGKVGDPGFTTPPKVVPDKNRRSLTLPEWKQEFFNTSTQPVGHGFNLIPPGHEEGFACYSFVPKPSTPLKVIVLDDTQREDDGLASIHGRGYLDLARWNWLKKELADGDAAGQLMIIAAHVPIAVSPHAGATPGQRDTYMDWLDTSATPAFMQNAVNLQGLLAELHSHPNLLAWIAGHRHINNIKAFLSDDPAKPERGFWQIETSSLHDFPQQFRLFEINLNNDYTISITAVNVDPAVKPGTPAAVSRKYAVAAQQIVKNPLIQSFKGADPSFPSIEDPSVVLTNSGMDPDISSCNAELLIDLSPEMKAKLKTMYQFS